MIMYYELYKEDRLIRIIVDKYIEQHNIEIWIDAENPFVNLDINKYCKQLYPKYNSRLTTCMVASVNLHAVQLFKLMTQ